MTTKFQPLHPSPWYYSLRKPLRSRWLIGLLLLGGIAGGGLGIYRTLAPSQNAANQMLTVPVEQQSFDYITVRISYLADNNNGLRSPAHW